ncbi:AzlC family ABC transporter permease [Streptomyces sp. WMMC897]|uniref:AzlC family ABC transporter permease n=1 Tax=Streptomyces sp. WMMC897 TaxID=3014782 RepID=UPI0022B68842|nr:AzlC family ABC transporter permease [Streptomyces sp. WMMC897]MCZ7414849.1 AzlC family ABC transporter permease [Streptomyces sp. WMMC897]
MGVSTAVVDPPAGLSPAAPASRGRSEARRAFEESAAVGLGFIPLGVAFGALVTQSGLDWWWAGLSAALIYGGSFEFLLIGLVSAVAPLTTVAVTAFLVNVRHVFYALSFPLHRVRGRLGKAYSTFALTDEAYALTGTAGARAWSGKRVLCVQLFLHLYWVGGATAGALLGALIPDGVVGLEFALTALFTVLALDALRERRGDLPTPLLALSSALLAWLVAPNQLLLVAFALFTAALLARRVAHRREASRA